MINQELLAKTGKPCGPGEGFQGATWRGGEYRDYASTDAMHAAWRSEHGIPPGAEEARLAKQITMRKAA